MNPSLAKARFLLQGIRNRVRHPGPLRDEWVAAFTDIFGAEPTEAQRSVLREVAARNQQARSARQRYRAVIAGLDQQELATAFTIRWGPDDVRLHEVEGFSLYLDRADMSVAQVIRSGAYERHLLAFFKAFVRPGMHVIDAGANIGFYTLLSASLAGPLGRVWSFEPNPENARLVLASAAHNGFRNIELHPVALGNRRGHAEFTPAMGSNGGLSDAAHRNVLHPACRIVPIARLDDFVPPRADLLKMDVEGAEGMLLEGARASIERCRPVIVSEFSAEMLQRISGWQGADFIRCIVDMDYAAFMSDRRSHALKPITDASAFAGGFAGTGRIEDLVFCPRERLALLPLVA